MNDEERVGGPTLSKSLGEIMNYAFIAIDNPVTNTDRLFTYECFEKSLQIGDEVLIPFGKGNRLIKGWVFGRKFKSCPLSNRSGFDGGTGQAMRLHARHLSLQILRWNPLLSELRQGLVGDLFTDQG